MVSSTSRLILNSTSTQVRLADINKSNDLDFGENNLCLLK